MAAVRIDSDLPTLVDLLPKEAKTQRRVLQAVEREVGGLRFERVYVQPRKLVQASGLDSAAVSRALKELAKLQAFDYVPPFRGRAVHMLIRDKEFGELNIDFDEQQRHKADEYAKLDRMIAYAEAHGCRQLEILDYFGDSNREVCRSCDNCQLRAKNQAGPASLPSAASGRREPQDKVALTGGHDHREADASRSPSPEIVAAVRIVLSGVARMKGRYGKQMLAKMLVGSKAKEIGKFRLDKLSTFGLLAHLTEPQASGLIDSLLAARLLMQVEETPHRPLVRLTPRGEEVMKGTAELTERLNLSQELSARLQAVRPGRSEKEKKIQRAAVPEFHQPPPDDAAAAADRPSYYWTWRLLSAGFTAAECEQIRGLDRSALLAHVLSAGKAGLAIDAGWVLSPEQLAALAQNPGNGRPPPGLQPLEAEVYQLIHTRRGG
jgi:ATP-dependent DNA helicase RecQ